MRGKVALSKIFRTDAAHTQALSTVHSLSSMEEMRRQVFRLKVEGSEIPYTGSNAFIPSFALLKLHKSS